MQSNLHGFEGKVVLVTGACGTVGRELVRQLRLAKPAEIVGIDNNESELFFMSETYRDVEWVRFYLGDIGDLRQLMERTRGVDFLLHAAALKHVILSEHSPREVVKTNILGTQNVIDAARSSRVSRVLFTSSDKAVNPTSVMGTSKLMGERLMTAANASRRGEGPVFASTRFGNVLGSRGSVIPLFRRQIARGGPVTLTDERMTRFVMSLRQAAGLVLQSTLLARGGEVFVTKMPVARIADLASVMIEALAPRHGFRAADIPVETIGGKPGEKLYEELVSEEETRRTIEVSGFYSVLPAFRSVYKEIDYDYGGGTPGTLGKPYNSSLEPALSRDELMRYLDANGLFEET